MKQERPADAVSRPVSASQAPEVRPGGPTVQDDWRAALAEESVDLTPGVVWTDAQLVVVRHLVARVYRAEADLRAALDATPDHGKA